MRKALKLETLALLTACALGSAHATPTLIAIGDLSGSSAGSFKDLSGLAGNLENGVAANLLGGIGSGLAYAGGNTFLALPDRGPNAAPYNPLVDDTSSYIARFHTITLDLTANTTPGGLPYVLTPTLGATTLLWSASPLTYGAGSLGTGSVTSGSTTTNYTLGSGVPAANTTGKYYFTGRSDGFDPTQSSLNPNNARLDPEGIRLSNDGRSVFVADEYGPYVYQYDRSSGQRVRSFALPAEYGITSLSAIGKTEIATNTLGRVTNKGMEGLAITPDGKSLVGFMQSPLAQDGGDGGRYNRIVKIDIATGAVKQYVYDNQIAAGNFNSSELLAVNNDEFLVLERDGKGLGSGNSAAVKQLFKINLGNATELPAGVSGAGNLAAYAVVKTQFLDIKSALASAVGGVANIPSKLEGASFGEDIVLGGKTMHTLYIANDNDFLDPASAAAAGVTTAGSNKFFVFAFSDADLNGSPLILQSVGPVPEPESYALMLAGLVLVGAVARRRKTA